jgi:hypothetical protein
MFGIDLNTHQKKEVTMRRLIIFFTLYLFSLMVTNCDNSSIVKNNAPPLESQTQNTKTKSAFDTADSLDKRIIEGEYIIIFNNQFSGRIDQTTAQQADQLTNEILSTSNIAQNAVRSKYKYAIKGFSAKLSESKVETLKRDPRIKSVTPNVLFKLDYARKLSSGYIPVKEERSITHVMVNSQSTPWGVNRVNGPLDGTGQTAWILDTGIDLDHQDLNVDINNSASFIATESADDQVGHGTHVAGILAAKDNTRDVVGVAAGATVVAVKVCNSLPPSDPNSGCPASSIINGVDYVSIKASPNDIVNMSLGGPDPGNNYTMIDNAVTNAANAGIRFSIAAGNSASNASSFTPARVNNSNVWTVSAFRQGDQFVQTFDWNTPNCNPLQSSSVGSNFSNPPVDFSGPGESVLSLWKNGGTLTTCGTSMAAPHIAGLLLASPNGITNDGFVTNDPDSDPDPIGFPDIYLTTSISGPTSLSKGQQGTWTASVSDGDGNYSYEWYYRSDDTNNQWDGPVSYTDSYSTQMYDFDGLLLDIRVDVSDGSGRSGSSSIRVRCTDCEPGGGGGPLSVDN